jgi:Protein of unknown function DUF72
LIWEAFCHTVLAGITVILRIKGVGLEYSIQAVIQSDSDIIHIFDTVEMDSIFYEKFYFHMSRGTFIGMVKATPEKFQFSVKVPETITHRNRLDVRKGAITDFEVFFDKITLSWKKGGIKKTDGMKDIK